MCAYYLVLLLVGRQAEPPAGLAEGYLHTVEPQADLPVDDVLATTSEGGAVYVDCKSSLRLQYEPDSDLGMCFRGFARLYLGALISGGGHDPSCAPWARALDVRRDRLLIAVGRQTPANTEAVLQQLVQAAEQEAPRFVRGVRLRPQSRGAFDFLKQLLAEEARAATGRIGRRITNADVHSLLRLVRVVRYRFGEDEPTEREALNHLRRDVLSDPGAARNAWQVLLSIAGEQHARGQAFDLHGLRARLHSEGVRLAGAPDYRPDFQKLMEESTRDLAWVPDEVDFGPDGMIRVDRPMVASLSEKLKEGHLIMHGDPGCGKSWVAKRLAEQWALGTHEGDAACLFLRAKSVQELELEHPLLQVLKAWAPGSNLLVLDGLDALRDPDAAQRLSESIPQVVSESNWTVLLSIRAFDAQYSPYWASIIESSQAQLAALPRLDEAELNAALAGAPAVQQLVQSSTAELRELLLLPFNLRLLADVVRSFRRSARALDSLTGMRTQVELLDRYWENLVRGQDESGAREQCALQAAHLIWQTGGMEFPRVALVRDAPAVRVLERDGVFVSRQTTGPGDWLSFFHDALADYACAKVLRAQGAERIRETMAESGSVFFRMPAFRMLFADALRCPSRDFWPLCREVVEDRRLRALVRAAPLHALAEAAPSRQDLQPLVDWLDRGQPAAAEAVRFLFIWLVRKQRANPERDGVWLELADDLCSRLDGQFTGPLLAYLELWVEGSPRLADAQVQQVNRGARAVWEKARREGWRFGRLTGRAAGAIAATLHGGDATSRGILRTVVEEHDHDECYYVARYFGGVIAADPRLAADLMLRAFGYTETSEEEVPLGGSYVLSLVQSRRQAWGMVWHQLSESFPALMEASPADGARVAVGIAVTLWADESKAREENYRRFAEVVQKVAPEDSRARPVETPPRPIEGLEVGGVQYRHERDYSYMWYDAASRIGDYRKGMLAAFEDWLSSSLPGSPGETALAQVFSFLYSTNSLAVIWNRCLDAAAKAPAALARHVFPLLAAPEVLRSLESRHHAATALPAVFPLYSIAQRREIERAILSLPRLATSKDERKWLQRAADGLIAALPIHALTSARARKRVDTLKAAGEQPEVEPPVRVGPGEWAGYGDRDEWLRREGVDVSSPAYLRLKQLGEPVVAFVARPSDAAPTVDELRKLYPAFQALETELRPAIADQYDSRQHVQARTALATAARVIACHAQIPYSEPALEWAILHLLSSASDPEPTVKGAGEDEQPGSDYAGSPAPRIEAAEGLVLAAGRADLPPHVCAEIEQTVRQLAKDPAATVRMQVAGELAHLHGTSEHLMWELAEHFVNHDESPRVLTFLFGNSLGRLVHRYPARVTNLASRVLERTGTRGGLERVTRYLIEIMAVGYVSYAEPEAEARLRALLTLPISDASPLQTVAQALRGAAVYGDDSADASQIRSRAISLYTEVAQHASTQLQSIAAAHADGSPRSPEEEQRMKAALQVLDTVAAELNFSVPDDLATRGDSKVPVDVRCLMQEASDLLSLMADVRHPGVHSHFIHLLVKTVNDAPRETIELLARSLGMGQGEPDLRHNEHLILTDVLKIVRICLADHRALVQTDRGVREALEAILDGFVQAGWLEAYEMVVRLEGGVRSAVRVLASEHHSPKPTRNSA